MKDTGDSFERRKIQSRHPGYRRALLVTSGVSGAIEMSIYVILYCSVEIVLVIVRAVFYVFSAYIHVLCVRVCV